MSRTKVAACVLVGTVAMLLGAQPVVWAAHGEESRWADTPLHKLISGHIGRWMVLRSELNVSGEQKAKIKEVVQSQKPEIATAAKAVWEKHVALRSAVLADQPDEQVIRKASDDLGKAIGDAAVLASKVAGQVKPILTTEQREKIKQFRQECETSTAGFFERSAKAQ